jgi:hypothetical protein
MENLIKFNDLKLKNSDIANEILNKSPNYRSRKIFENYSSDRVNIQNIQ